MNIRNDYCKRCGKKLIITEYEDRLVRALRKKGIKVQQQKCDGYKHIDIVILPYTYKINIEVDGSPHRRNRNQRKSDWLRDKFSKKKVLKL